MPGLHTMTAIHRRTVLNKSGRGAVNTAGSHIHVIATVLNMPIVVSCLHFHHSQPLYILSMIHEELTT